MTTQNTVNVKVLTRVTMLKNIMIYGVYNNKKSNHENENKI